MAKLTLKELRTALHVLENLPVEVPSEIFVAISGQIRQIEAGKQERLMSKLSDEDLLRMENRPRRILRILTAEGRIIQWKSNEKTFLSALQAIGEERLQTVTCTVRRHPVIVPDPLHVRQRLKGYRFLCPGIFVYVRLSAVEMQVALSQIDAQLQLDWEILLM